MTNRIGQGIDVHPLVEHRALVLGGVAIPFHKGLEGDTDGDVLTHAYMDAILGALAIGDLGTYFHANDPGVRGAKSLQLLERVAGMMTDKGYQIVSADMTVMAERPRLALFVPTMRQNLSHASGCPLDALSIKATTTDHLGAIGREEGILALATVLLSPA
ncbi:MAG: 2-C-methyl-D-erythritol 2,4-cyclodiphosphate synthase [Firmicutes bacterium]|uniref:2-C-methyl-D-erythritol 2,4-cyclodiphosphate synthase n=1 Tax=Sulfobacillus benefaciens TaxID=453960 RepID=A0A2T2WUW3_9FIRM|nr:2-C-methyl-D-erythritol 2,4-cyclodiphosphate synthase [Bacillota bacterium]MCL5014623.1 2-C-methyl-D-erythritol 2,4-cyclodiphosphate synthase [Bacillota bacterium]PSR26020.1 MAG: 2-C-methyl-D-erythritol 2,4-cyclodiphosphate synthase [Sulfobacillus benefaciens]HBQ96556.1 2-C-methyl-D-erythritol 2,4-cyclodiphosphate synthase [Sulfobacillus sp.]